MTWQPDYCSASELKSFIRVADSVDDTQIGYAVTAASREIDRACDRQFGALAAATARYYSARWDRRRARWIVAIDDLMSTTNFALAVDSAGDATYSSTITAYDLKPLNAAGNGRPWTEIVIRATSTVMPTFQEDGVKATALYGWTAVPTPIKQAALLQASRILARRNSPYGIAGSPEMGSELRLLSKLDPDVELMVRPYRRTWAVAELAQVSTYSSATPWWGSY